MTIVAAKTSAPKGPPRPAAARQPGNWWALPGGRVEPAKRSLVVVLIDKSDETRTFNWLIYQYIDDDLLILFAFEQNVGKIAISNERHYRLVRTEELSNDEMAAYRARPL